MLQEDGEKVIYSIASSRMPAPRTWVSPPKDCFQLQGLLQAGQF